MILIFNTGSAEKVSLLLHYISFLCIVLIPCSTLGGGNPAPELVWYFRGSLWVGSGEVVEALAGSGIPSQVGNILDKVHLF